MAKTTTKKATANKPAAKKTTAKKATQKTTAKSAAKKTSAKTNIKSAAKKTSSKTTTKKTATKSTAKKTAAKKTSAKAKTNNGANIVEVISPTKKVRKIKGYPKKDLKDLKEIIIKKRDEIIDQLQSLKDQMMDPTTGQYVNENSPYSLHMAEQGTDAQEREKLYLWAQRENKFLGYLEDALQRIENGTYGICIECIDEPQNLCPTCPLIPIERLKAVPHTQHCLQVKQKIQSK
ncbi:MAG: conjugal transfer protein TraR [Ignavibacteria bacterium]|jgi:RNA polymerase-binding transcription factor DksA